MSKTRRLLPLALTLALATTAQSQTAARGSGGDSPPPPSIATVEITPSRLDWAPVQGIGNDPITLTIAGPQGFYFEKRFPRGMPPAFDLGEVRDRTLPDGAYSYELRTQGKGGGRVQSGFLSVREGKIFVPATGARSTEPPSSGRKPSGPPLQLKVINASECVGDGCVAGNEGFPLRLKSPSALRLDFTDGPDAFTNNHSWAIQANDVFIGGGTYLAVQDVDAATTPLTILANAPDNSLVVGSSGNVGIGTATPAVKLDAKVTSSGSAVARLQNLSSTGYSGIEYLNAAGAVTTFVGVDNAAANTRLNSIQNYPMVFLTESVERMRITSAGKIGVGTNAPSEKFHFFENADANTFILAENPNTGPNAAAAIRALSDSAKANFQAHSSGRTISRFGQVLASWAEFLQVTGNGLIIGTLIDKPLILGTNSTNRFEIASGGNIGIGGVTSPTSPIQHSNGATLSAGGVWTNASSRKLKQDIHDLDATAAFTALQGLAPVEFAYKADPAEHHVGFIAEDVPDLVAQRGRTGLSPMDVVAVLTKVVQEQQKAIEELRAQVAELKSKP
jgi:hypothetical protein